MDFQFNSGFLITNMNISQIICYIFKLYLLLYNLLPLLDSFVDSKLTTAELEIVTKVGTNPRQSWIFLTKKRAFYHLLHPPLIIHFVHYYTGWFSWNRTTAYNFFEQKFQKIIQESEIYILIKLYIVNIHLPVNYN